MSDHSNTCGRSSCEPTLSTGTSNHVASSYSSQCSTFAKPFEGLECATDKSTPTTSTSGAPNKTIILHLLLSSHKALTLITPVGSADGDYKKRAQKEYYEKAPNKWVDLHYIDHSRRSMYKELERDFERKLTWARSLGIGKRAL